MWIIAIDVKKENSGTKDGAVLGFLVRVVCTYAKMKNLKRFFKRPLFSLFNWKVIERDF